MTSVEPELIEEMFVQVASGSDSTDGVLTLTGLSPTTLYFSDRPERVVGHMTTAQFVDQWSFGDNSFASDPPNAVLSWVDSGENRPEDCVVVLREPKTDGDSIRYASISSRAQYPRRRVHAPCSSIRWGVHSRRSRWRACTGVTAAVADGGSGSTAVLMQHGLIPPTYMPVKTDRYRRQFQRGRSYCHTGDP